MASVRTYIPKEWNNFDIPTPEDLQNIENGIVNNNADIIAINEELNNYETDVNQKYETYKNGIDTSLQAEKDKLSNIDSKCQNGFTTLDNYIKYVDVLMSDIDKARLAATRAEEKINKYISNSIKLNYANSREFTCNLIYTKNPSVSSNFFMDWAQTGYLSYRRCGNEFSIAFNIQGSTPVVNGNIVLLKLPCEITPAENLELNMTTFEGGLRKKIILRTDGYVVLMESSNYRYTNIGIANYSSNESIWRYEGIDSFNILTM